MFHEALVRQIVFDIGKMFGNKNSRVDFGLAQWGLKQKPNESYIDSKASLPAKSEACVPLCGVPKVVIDEIILSLLPLNSGLLDIVWVVKRYVN
jgi:hypothetical protein